MPKTLGQYVVVGGGILIAGLLVFGLVNSMDGEEDPPPIIVSSGGSIILEIQGSDQGVFDQALGGVWYHTLDAKQHRPDWLEVTVKGAVDGNNVACDAYPKVKFLSIAYGGGNKKIDADIGWVWGLTLGRHLKFKPTPANGTQDSNNKRKVDFDKDVKVYLDSVTIHLDSGGSPVTCTFVAQSIDSKIYIQERHTP